ncbi:hypothetical protein LPMP_070820 [Leishmania panamensis]|uniref:Chaperone protein, putative n=1 Tax=Leishmania panamensis TaxID=5679 RepID=A0A088RIN9_LEIPA|nr:hypothetical protein LPMP_070820 [Leishmania panamensis]AIN95768.1 hypothetical protein LPMP_070820 [Leishmania panamensis]
MRTRSFHRAVTATGFLYRCISSGSSQHQQRQCVAAGELRAALRTLGLTEESTDADVKRAFQAFAIQHHPDTNTALVAAPSDAGEAIRGNERSAAQAAERMRLGTEAYHLLRQIPFEVRRHILRGEGRLRGPHDTPFVFTEEEYAKVQRVYQGDHRRRRHRGGRGRGRCDGDSGEDLFDTRTEEGRRRIARLNEFQARIAEMRRRGIRDDLPPWQVYESGKGAGTAGHSGSASTSGGSVGDEQQGRYGSPATYSGPRNPHRLGLHFFNATAASLRGVRDLYRSRPPFLGMDCSSYDRPLSAARVAPEISASTYLRQYILMKSCAQGKAIADRVMRWPLRQLLLLTCLSAAMTMMAAIVGSRPTGLQKG